MVQVGAENLAPASHSNVIGLPLDTASLNAGGSRYCSHEMHFVARPNLAVIRNSCAPIFITVEPRDRVGVRGISTGIGASGRLGNVDVLGMNDRDEQSTPEEAAATNSAGKCGL